MTSEPVCPIDYPRLNVRDLEGLATCPRVYVGSVIWWTQLARQLDDLREELICANVREFSRRFVAEAPELSDLGEQVPNLAVDVELGIVRVRSRVRESCGIPGEAAEVRAQVKAILHRMNLFNYLCEDLGHILSRRMPTSPISMHR